MFNHITLFVQDLEASKKFFTVALAPLGYRLLIEKTRSVGFGVEDKDGKRDFWIRVSEGDLPKPSFSCLAFTASSKNMVEEFYRAALNAGGTDNGAPGYRTRYHPGYYAAYVLDPNGYNIEAVFDDPHPTT